MVEILAITSRNSSFCNGVVSCCGALRAVGSLFGLGVVLKILPIYNPYDHFSCMAYEFSLLSLVIGYLLAVPNEFFQTGVSAKSI